MIIYQLDGVKHPNICCLMWMWISQKGEMGLCENNTDNPEGSTYSVVVSRESVIIEITYGGIKWSISDWVGYQKFLPSVTAIVK